MDNIKLFQFFHERQDLDMQQFFDIIDYWYEWIFNEEIYEKVIKYRGF